MWVLLCVKDNFVQQVVPQPDGKLDEATITEIGYGCDGSHQQVYVPNIELRK